MLELKWRVRLLMAGWLVALHIPLLAAFPHPDGYVNDFASVLDAEQEAYLEMFLRTVERETSAEIVVATVRSLEGMTVELYANRLFADWGIGKKQQDNGVLVLVAPDHRTVRIEVGYGLEPILPDGLAGEIIRTEMIPEFRNDNYPRGIGRGLNRIAQVVRRDPAAVASRAPGVATGNDPPPAIVIVPFFGIFIALGAYAAGLGIRTKTYGPLLGGSLCAGIPLLMAVAFSSVFSLFILVPLGLSVLAAAYKRGRSAYWTSILRTGSPDNFVRDDEPAEWVMGGAEGSLTGESPDSGGSSSGADFGGGSSGGGGATGRW